MTRASPRDIATFVGVYPGEGIISFDNTVALDDFGESSLSNALSKSKCYNSKNFSIYFGKFFTKSNWNLAIFTSGGPGFSPSFIYGTYL